MASAPDRGVITDWLLAHLRSQGYNMGDIEADQSFGWQTDAGSPGAEFVPYTTQIPGTATRSTGSFGDPSMDWWLPYTLTTYGVNRRQVEDLADDLRAGLLEVKKIPVTMKDGSTVWKITTIDCTAIGGVGYTNAVTPTAFSQTDSISLTVSRSL
jgi:hypothetical protein